MAMKSSRERLRQLLKASAPELHAALMRSWDIAGEEWLPALGAKSDSFNSYPHLRNVEHYLDDLVTVPPADGQAEDVRLRVAMTPAEMYILLAATLFHDLGKIEDKPPGAPPAKTKGHGDVSAERLRKDYANLGIPSRELARSIARVVAFHDGLEKKYDPGDKRPEQPRSLEAIDPYGVIREQMLASLLRLADYIDSTLTRVMPDYLRPLGEIEVVGAFRRVIADVEVDHEAQMMCTVLGDIPKGEPKEDVFVFTRSEDSRRHALPSARKKFRLTAGRLKRALRNSPSQPKDLIKSVMSRLCKKPDNLAGRARGERFEEPGPPKPRLCFDGVNRFTSKTPVPLVAEMLPKRRKPRNFSVEEWLLARRAVKMEVENKRDRNKRLKKTGKKNAKKKARNEEKPKAKWHPARLLAIVLGNVLQNARALVSVREDMAAMGIPLRAWLVCGNGRLFNLWGEETYEPLFTHEYLRRVATEMWRLSTRVFGQSLFTYQNLADALRDPDVDRVRRAVRRLEIVMRARTSSGKRQAEGDRRGAILAGDKRWRWVCGKAAGDGDSRWCDAVLLARVLWEIKQLGSPA
jgi:hypothetical protein